MSPLWRSVFALVGLLTLHLLCKIIDYIVVKQGNQQMFT